MFEIFPFPKFQFHAVMLPEVTVERSVNCVPLLLHTVVALKFARGNGATLTGTVVEATHPDPEVTFNNALYVPDVG